ncbi:MAG: hypothetical protein HOW73_34515 [Polyangiaceae bacterium]|nr:hypothetical protein [Polyangiaceae bacterium]
MDPTGFESADEAKWRAAAEAGLAGKSFDQVLMGATPEGIPIEPLYLERHRTSGVDVDLPERTFVGQRFDATGGADVRQAVRAALRSGVDVAWIAVDETKELEATLAGLDKSQPILLDAATRATRLAEKALDLGYTQVSAMFDPFGAALRSWGLDVPLEAALDQAGTFVRDAVALRALGQSQDPSSLFHRRALAFSAADVVDAGGHASHAIGYTLAGCLEVLRRLEVRGLDPAHAAGEMAIVVSCGTDVYGGIAFLRALRLGWAKLLAALGVEGAPAPLIVGTTSVRTLSRLDQPTNIIRVAVETFALQVGGADIVAPRVFDEASGVTTDLGRRLAKNTAIVLGEESHVRGVGDPASGSYFIDTLTVELARAGWNELGRIEREGGLISSLASGGFQRRVLDARVARAAQVAKRARTLVGVNEFAAAEDQPGAGVADDDRAQSTRTWPIRALEPGRDAEPFEALRLRARSGGKAPRAQIVRVGDAAKSKAREAFARSFLEVGGFVVSTDAGDQPAEAVVIVGTDDAYKTGAEAAVFAAKNAGARAIVLAGRPGDLESTLQAAGLTHSIHLGADVPAVVGSILDRVQRSR